MRIGHNDNSLSIEKVGQNTCPIWRFEATVIGAGWMFAGMYDRVIANSSPEIRKAMADFAALRAQRFEVELSEGGWLRLKRDARGYILLRYRVSRLQAGAALEGEIVLESDFAGGFCSELAALL